jgi:hypothetical protein
LVIRRKKARERPGWIFGQTKKTLHLPRNAKAKRLAKDTVITIDAAAIALDRGSWRKGPAFYCRARDGMSCVRVTRAHVGADDRKVAKS